MDTIGDRQKVRLLPRLTPRTVVAGVLGAAAIGAALLFSAGTAHATSVSVPGIGDFEVPNEIADRLGIIAPALQPAVGDTEEFHPVTIPAVGDATLPEVSTAEAPRMTTAPGWIVIAPVMPQPEAVAAVVPEPVAPAAVPPMAESRSVVVSGLGSFQVPSALPPLAGIPGVTDAAAAPVPGPAVMPKRSTGERAVEAARSKLGAYYRTGGNGPDSFDCSGLVQWSYHEAGVDVPRTSYSQLASGTPVSVDELEPGDLVSYYGGGHSALYLGDGQIIHASDYGSGVKISPLNNMPVTGARRY
ncbi:C40 family peptidase [Nocardia sp. NBC_00511]|uniref:C40 family peptidase n=1 Tax=Nocardia sp. NBC_00511 TaxID=2903591 RepID=UPI0030E2106C